MENEQTNYELNKTMMEYYNANVDVHIGHLLFLNSLMKISKVGYLEVAPKLEKIREKMHKSFGDALIPNNTIHINMEVEEKLKEFLSDAGIGDAHIYIRHNMGLDEVVNLATAIFLRRQVKHQVKLDGTKNEELIINAAITEFNKKRPESNIKIIDDGLDVFYSNELGINYSEDNCLQKYIYEVLTNCKLIMKMSSRLNNEIFNTSEIDFLLDELFQAFFITSSYSLVQIIDDLNLVLENLKKKEKKSSLVLANN